MNRDAHLHMAARYEAIGLRYERPASPDPSSPAGRATHEIREIAAHALLAAARAYLAAGDSVHMLGLYDRIATRYADLADVASEVAFARGQMAEARGAWADAAAEYRTVIERIVPSEQSPGLPQIVVELPLQVARLEARARPQDRAAVAAAYETARARYESWQAVHAGTKIELTARTHLALIAADQGDPARAELLLRDLEADLVAVPKRGADPAAIRMAIANVQPSAAGGSRRHQATLLSLVKDYPRSILAPQALLALAQEARAQGRPEEALGFVDRIRTEYPGATDILSQSLILRGRMLDQLGRWPEALETYRALPVEAPFTEAALQSPLEIVAHFSRAQDGVGTQDALVKAETHYRDFIARQPPPSMTISARTRLAQTLTLQERYPEAIAELVQCGKSLGASAASAKYFVDAGQIALEMGDTEQAADLFAHAGELAPHAEIGRQATQDALRIRAEATP
jgi:TolA-binding protein